MVTVGSVAADTGMAVTAINAMTSRRDTFRFMGFDASLFYGSGTLCQTRPTGSLVECPLVVVIVGEMRYSTRYILEWQLLYSCAIPKVIKLTIGNVIILVVYQIHRNFSGTRAECIPADETVILHITLPKIQYRM
jgi:hypothetical protein